MNQDERVNQIAWRRWVLKHEKEIKKTFEEYSDVLNLPNEVCDYADKLNYVAYLVVKNLDHKDANKQAKYLEKAYEEAKKKIEC
jgi:hypothetical protein